MTPDREDWKHSGALSPHDYYEPLDLLNRDRILFAVGPATEGMHRSAFPADLAEALLARLHAFAAPESPEDFDAVAAGASRFSRWSPAGDPDFNGKGLRRALGLAPEAMEDLIPNPFGRDVLELFGGGWLAPEDVTGVDREAGR